MKILMFIILVLFSCDFAEDPISRNFRLAKSVILIEDSFHPDPQMMDTVTALHHLLYDNISTVAKAETKDSLEWTLTIREAFFNVSSDDRVEIDDIIFSIDRQIDKIREIYPKFNIKTFNGNKLLLKAKQDLNLLFSEKSIFLYSKNLSIGDLPVGTGKYFVFMRPEKNQYLLMPFVKFIHLNNKEFDRIFWTNISISEIKNKRYNFVLPDITKYQMISLDKIE